MEASGNTLPKEERLCSKKDISGLLAGGTFCDAQGRMKACFRRGTGNSRNRIMVSVPKKLFKRAVRRNLLKRRIRESYRKQKSMLSGNGTDILFIYGNKEIMTYEEIFSSVRTLLQKINRDGDR